MSNLVSIQPSDTSHHNFIKSAWLRSFYNGKAGFCENITPDTFFKNHEQVVENILKRAKTLVALSKDAPDVAVGYITYEDNLVHYVYVKHQFKRFGIATELFRATEIDPQNFNYSHRTWDCSWLIGVFRKVKDKDGNSTGRREFIKGKLPNGNYNPYEAFK